MRNIFLAIIILAITALSLSCQKDKSIDYRQEMRDFAKNHGVFVSDRRTPSVLKQMLQKPSVQTLADLQRDHFYMTDIGVWL
ncbi:MAG: hypothetical protein II088_09845, partial [Bacteroidales bacterium]|nr:hypothetical protein [Bacteroidales bacterium]